MKVTVTQWTTVRDGSALLELNHATKSIKVHAYNLTLAQLGELAEACVEATTLLTQLQNQQQPTLATT